MQETPINPLPQSHDSEEYVIKAIFSMPDQCKETVEKCISQQLTPESFIDPAYQLIFAAVLDVHHRGLAPDNETVADVLRKQDKLDSIGGVLAIFDLGKQNSGFPNLIHQIIEIKDAQSRRKIVVFNAELQEKASKGQLTASELAAAMELGAKVIQRDSDTYRALSMSDRFKDDEPFLEEVITGAESTRGLSTGFYDLDRIIGGLMKGTVNIIGARTGSGKSVFAANFVENIMTSNPVNTLFISTEMKREEIALRIRASLTGVPAAHLRDKLVNDRLDEMRAALVKIYNWPWNVIMSGEFQHIGHLSEIIRQHHKNAKLGLIVVDYLQQINSTIKKGTREQEVAEVSRTLKNLAIELDCPIVAVSQLNRDVEKNNRRPKKSDLRESGSIEMDADTVMLLHEKRNEEGQLIAGENITEIIIDKNRRGEEDFCKLYFQKNIHKFRPLAYGEK